MRATSTIRSGSTGGKFCPFFCHSLCGEFHFYIIWRNLDIHWATRAVSMGHRIKILCALTERMLERNVHWISIKVWRPWRDLREKGEWIWDGIVCLTSVNEIRLIFTLMSHLTPFWQTNTTKRRAPLPFQCAPKSQLPITGFWDEKNLEENYDTAFANQMGRVDVEGCCWWGRGVLRDVTRGRCFFGQLNYHIGKRAAMECRPSMYPEIDFCNFPGKVTFQYIYFYRRNSTVLHLRPFL